MNINVPLVELMRLWIADLRAKGKSPSEPYAEGTLRSYAGRAKGYPSLDCDLSTESLKQYFDERKKKVGSRTLLFEDTALNLFFGWLVANNLIKDHPNPDYPRGKQRKDNATKS